MRSNGLLLALVSLSIGFLNAAYFDKLSPAQKDALSRAANECSTTAAGESERSDACEAILATPANAEATNSDMAALKDLVVDFEKCLKSKILQKARARGYVLVVPAKRRDARQAEVDRKVAGGIPATATEQTRRPGIEATSDDIIHDPPDFRQLSVKLTTVACSPGFLDGSIIATEYCEMVQLLRKAGLSDEEQTNAACSNALARIPDVLQEVMRRFPWKGWHVNVKQPVIPELPPASPVAQQPQPSTNETLPAVQAQPATSSKENNNQQVGQKQRQEETGSATAKQPNRPNPVAPGIDGTKDNVEGAQIESSPTLAQGQANPKAQPDDVSSQSKPKPSLKPLQAQQQNATALAEYGAPQANDTFNEEEAVIRLVVKDAVLKTCTLNLIEGVVKKIFCDTIYYWVSSTAFIAAVPLLLAIDTYLPGTDNYFLIAVRAVFCMREELKKGLRDLKLKFAASKKPTTETDKLMKELTMKELTGNSTNSTDDGFSLGKMLTRWAPPGVNITGALKAMDDLGIGGREGLGAFADLLRLVPAIINIPGVEYIVDVAAGYSGTAPSSNTTAAKNDTKKGWVKYGGKLVKVGVWIANAKAKGCDLMWKPIQKAGKKVWDLKVSDLWDRVKESNTTKKALDKISEGATKVNEKWQKHKADAKRVLGKRDVHLLSQVDSRNLARTRRQNNELSNEFVFSDGVRAIELRQTLARLRFGS